MINVIRSFMSKKQYIKPQMEVLDDSISTILAVSGFGTGGEYTNARQQDNVFAEDDDDNDELF